MRSAGGTYTAETIMPDGTQTDTWDPLSGFTETWPAGPAIVDPVGPLQVGAFEGQTLQMPEISVSSFGLGVASLDLVDDAGKAIAAFDRAINQISSVRSRLGGLQNRLEHALTVNVQTAENLTATESKIRDADMALEMVQYAREQILVRSSSAMLAQANSLRRSQVQKLLG